MKSFLSLQRDSSNSSGHGAAACLHEFKYDLSKVIESMSMLEHLPG